MTWLLGPALDPGLEIEGLQGLFALLLIAAVLPAVCEECLFRGAIQGVLERRGPVFSILVSGLLFGLFHLDPWRILPAAFLGCVFGWLTYRTQSLMPAILGHFANNATAVTAGYLFSEADAFPSWLLPSLAVLFLAAMGLFLILTSKCPFKGKDANPLAAVDASLPAPINWLCGLFIGGFVLTVTALSYLVVVTTKA